MKKRRAIWLVTLILAVGLGVFFYFFPIIIVHRNGQLIVGLGYRAYTPKNITEELVIYAQDPSSRTLWWAVLRDAPYSIITNWVTEHPGIIQKEEAQDDFQCALTEAARKRRDDVVLFLLKQGANPQPYFDFVAELAKEEPSTNQLLLKVTQTANYIRSMMGKRENESLEK